MKLKLLLLFLFVVSCGVVLRAQTVKPYNKLIITEARLSGTPDNYVEVTNMGDETIDLKDFEIAKFSPWPPAGADGLPDNWAQEANNFFRLWEPTMYPANSPLLNKRYLAPGKSFLIAIARDFGPEMWLKDPLHYSQRSTKKEFFQIADLLLHTAEENSIPGLDSITPNWNFLDAWHGYCGMFIRHHFTKIVDGVEVKDSMIIDVFNGQFDEADGTNSSPCDCGFDVAGFVQATRLATLVRKNSVKQGISDFSSHEANLAAATLQFNSHKGIDLEDSEWIPIPNQGGNEAWKAVYWTAGNQVNQVLNASLLESKTGKVTVDLANMKITVPWGVRDQDSLMFQFKKKPGLGWKYALSPNVEDSATISASIGDTLILYITGDNPVIKKFAIDVFPPTADDNIVVPKNGYDWTNMRYPTDPNAYNAGWSSLGLEVTDKVPGMDTIRGLDFATRIDTLYRYLEKAPKATWKVIFKSGIEKPDIQTGDILRVTSENAKVKDYYIKCFPFVPGNDPYLGSITWPDMPSWFKGDVAKSYGWKGDTIPGFSSLNLSYVVRIPSLYDGIPALAFTKVQLDSKVTVKRATTLNGTLENRTVYFYTVAEDDSTERTYAVRFEKEKDQENIQPWVGDAFISQWVYKDDWANDYLEIVNPSTEPIDMSNYMFIFAWGPAGETFGWDNATTEFGNAYLKYVPGKKWQDEANWLVQPRILEPDLNINSIVYPGDVFVMASVQQDRMSPYYDPYYKEIDINFRSANVANVPNNPWGYTGWNNLMSNWQGNWGGNIFMYKITNDSVKNGLKAATDINDFELLEILGNNNDGLDFAPDGSTDNFNALFSYYRKPGIYKPNPVARASYGTSPETSEWTMVNEPKLTAQGVGWPLTRVGILNGIGSHIMNDVTIYRSTVSSVVYKVSPGYSMQETIKGLTTGTTVTGFYLNIIKANELQSLKVKSGANGAELAEAAAISDGDILVVLSADSVNTSEYILDVTIIGLSSNALLTSTNYTITATGTTGTISGIPPRTHLETVFAGVIVPAGATLTITDANDAYMSLTKLNYDSAYVNVIATDNVFFEVIAENGTTKIQYQLSPTTNPSDAYVTSDVYSVEQFAALIQFVPGGTSVHSLLNNVTPAPGAIMTIYDKAGFVRTLGDVYRDDKLMVTSADGNSTKAYYFSMLNFNVNKYLAYVISDDYLINQVTREISGPETLTISDFFAKLYPSFGATLSVIDKNGNANTSTKFNKGDKLLVTAADGLTTAVYIISPITKAIDVDAVAIKMYPNPTTDRVIINGLSKGNRLQVFNATGVALRDVIIDNSTSYVSLAAHPAGIYIFVISSGDKHINIQKIIKK